MAPSPSPQPPRLPQFWVILLSVSAASGAVTSVLISPTIGVPSAVAVAALLYQIMI